MVSITSRRTSWIIVSNIAALAAGLAILELIFGAWSATRSCRRSGTTARCERKSAEHTGATFIDLAAEPVWDDADFYDFEHMTPAGAAKVGRCLFDELTRPAGVASQEKGTTCSASHAG